MKVVNFLTVAVVLGCTGFGYAVIVPQEDFLPVNNQIQFRLDSIQPPASEEELIKLLETGTYEQKIEAAIGLAWIGTEKAVPPLLIALRDDLKYERVGAGYPGWIQGELSKVAEGALIAIGHAIKKPAVDLLVKAIQDKDFIKDGEVIIPLARILSQVGGNEAAVVLGKIASDMKIYPPIRNAAQSAQETIYKRLSREPMYDAFLTLQGVQFELPSLAGVLPNLERLQDILFSLRDELMQTYALNNSGELGELLSKVFAVRSQSLKDVSWRRDVGRDPMGNLYPADIIVF
ncbi:MAG: HEAT repeat domain-containing protein, partial [Candidatus Omnitrophota bacterium]